MKWDRYFMWFSPMPTFTAQWEFPYIERLNNEKKKYPTPSLWSKFYVFLSFTFSQYFSLPSFWELSVLWELPLLYLDPIAPCLFCRRVIIRRVWTESCTVNIGSQLVSFDCNATYQESHLDGCHWLETWWPFHTTTILSHMGWLLHNLILLLITYTHYDIEKVIK